MAELAHEWIGQLVLAQPKFGRPGLPDWPKTAARVSQTGVRLPRMTAEALDGKAIAARRPTIKKIFRAQFLSKALEETALRRERGANYPTGIIPRACPPRRSPARRPACCSATPRPGARTFSAGCPSSCSACAISRARAANAWATSWRPSARCSERDKSGLASSEFSTASRAPQSSLAELVPLQPM